MIIPVLHNGSTITRLAGNPILASLDGETQARLRTILHESWSPEDRAAYGVYHVDTTPPEGQRWTGDFVDVEGVPEAVFEPQPIIVPAVVSMRQARLALLGAGLLSQVDAALGQMDEPDRSAATIEWEYATELRRAHPLIASLAGALELTEQQVDDLFIAASQIG